jgi:putative spermidine/putrescine transport system permease protein
VSTGTRLAPAGFRSGVWNRAAGLAQGLVPGAVLVAFFALPLALLLPLAANPQAVGVARITSVFTLQNVSTFFGYSLYWGSAVNSIVLSVITTVVALVLGYPIAHVIARAATQRRETLLTFAVLVSMQLGIIERLYGMSVLLGDNGLVNQVLKLLGAPTLPLMYNRFGIAVGLVQLALPFMVMSLVGVIQSQPRSLEEAARSLGAGPWRVFWKIEVPLAKHGVLNGCLLVFAISVSSYVVPVVMGGSQVPTLPDNIYQQISGSSLWQLGALLAIVLLLISVVFVALHALLARGPKEARS